jgi:hypothetical protein
LLLARRCGHDRIDQGVVHFQGVSEMLRHVRRHPAGHHRGGERLMPLPDLTVAESRNKLAPTYPERPCALKKEPTDRVCAFPEAHPESGTSQSSVPVVVPDAADVVWRH